MCVPNNHFFSALNSHTYISHGIHVLNDKIDNNYLGIAGRSFPHKAQRCQSFGGVTGYIAQVL